MASLKPWQKRGLPQPIVHLRERPSALAPPLCNSRAKCHTIYYEESAPAGYGVCRNCQRIMERLQRIERR